MKTLIAILTTLLFLVIAHTSLAAPTRTIASTVTCQWGDLSASASSEAAARRSIANKCADHNLDIYASRTAGATPDAESELEDLIIDTCTNDVSCQ